jgi:hypothetical protein
MQNPQPRNKIQSTEIVHTSSSPLAAASSFSSADVSAVGSPVHTTARAGLSGLALENSVHRQQLQH